MESINGTSKNLSDTSSTEVDIKRERAVLPVMAFDCTPSLAMYIEWRELNRIFRLLRDMAIPSDEYVLLGTWKPKPRIYRYQCNARSGGSDTN